jgi:hypothetical protein
VLLLLLLPPLQLLSLFDASHVPCHQLIGHHVQHCLAEGILLAVALQALDNLRASTAQDSTGQHSTAQDSTRLVAARGQRTAGQ